MPTYAPQRPNGAKKVSGSLTRRRALDRDSTQACDRARTIGVLREYTKRRERLRARVRGEAGTIEVDKNGGAPACTASWASIITRKRTRVCSRRSGRVFALGRRRSVCPSQWANGASTGPTPQPAASFISGTTRRQARRPTARVPASSDCAPSTRISTRRPAAGSSKGSSSLRSET
jgi:hypothetical protein